jgi:acetate kinase
MKNLPNAKQAACFDTAFHASIPKVAYIYALPYELYEKYGIRRYGFHGTSHRYVSEIAAEMLGKKPEDTNIITAHLGNGGSLTAVKAGKSIDTSMGLTPLEGIAMGTRCGDIDPAILFYLQEKGYKTQELKNICNKKSGLLGISNKSNDMRNLTQLAEQGDELSKLAIEVFAYRIRKYIGTYTAVLGTLDAVVFTGGIGENSFIVRQKVCKSMEQIGIEIDEAINAKVRAKQADISKVNSRVKVFVVPTDEEVIIARDTYSLANQEN